MAKGRRWQREEIMLTIELYCRTPFGQIDQDTKSIIELAGVLNRSPGAVSMKMANLASLDETLDQRGLEGASDRDREVWSEFLAAPAAFLDQVESIRQTEFIIPQPMELSGFREGYDVEYTAKGRRNQDFFRRAVLAAYDDRCAVTGISQTELLVASHIVPWAEDADLRVLPTNGICLNALHDRAFDKHLISFEDDHTMIVSKRLKLTAENRAFFEGLKLKSPTRFSPDTLCLSKHRDRMIEKERA